MKKQLLSIILAMVMVIGMIPSFIVTSAALDVITLPEISAPGATYTKLGDDFLAELDEFFALFPEKLDVTYENGVMKFADFGASSVKAYPGGLMTLVDGYWQCELTEAQWESAPHFMTYGSNNEWTVSYNKNLERGSVSTRALSLDSGIVYFNRIAHFNLGQEDHYTLSYREGYSLETGALVYQRCSGVTPNDANITQCDVEYNMDGTVFSIDMQLADGSQYIYTDVCWDVIPTGYTVDTLAKWYPFSAPDGVYGEDYPAPDPAEYSITIDSGIKNGSVSVSASKAKVGETVKLSVSVDDGYALDTLSVMQGSTPVSVKGNSFVMPAGEVTVSATFKLPAENEKTFYLINSYEWDEVFAYAEAGDISMEWPGVMMTKTKHTVQGFDVYSVTVDEVYTHITFNNNDGCRTASTDLTEDHYIEPRSHTWYASLDTVGDIDLLKVNCAFIIYEDMVANGNEMKLKTPGTSVGYLTLELEANTTYNFRVVHESVLKSNTTPIVDSVSGMKLSEWVNGSGTITTTTAGKYVIAFDLETSELSVTYPGTETFYKVGVAEVQNGKVTADKKEAVEGDTVTLTVTPDDGYSLEKLVVTDAYGKEVKLSDNTFTMPAGEVTVSATFKKNVVTYKINIDATISGGTVKASTDTAAAGDKVSLTVAEDAGYVLKSLTVTQGTAKVEISAANTFIMPEGDVTVSAKFEKAAVYYSIAVDTAISGGTVKASATTAMAGEMITLEVVADSGYSLEKLAVYDATGVEVPVTDNSFAMPASHVTVWASFKNETGVYKIKIEETVNGTVVADKLEAIAGETVLLTVTPDSGYTLKKIIYTDAAGKEYVPVKSGKQYKFTMPECDVTVTVTFLANCLTAQAKTIDIGDILTGKSYETTITVTNTSDKNVVLEPSSIKFNDTDIATVTATDSYAKGYVLESGESVTVKVSITAESEESAYVSATLIFDGMIEGTNESIKSLTVTVKAYIGERYSISVDSTVANGKIKTSVAKAPAGETIKLTFTPNKGYILSGYSVVDAEGNKVAVTDNLFVMPASNVTVWAEFKSETATEYKVSVDSSVKFGKVEADKTSAVAGDTVTLTFTPDDGFKFKWVKINGTIVDEEIKDGVYSFKMPEEAVVITASFGCITHKYSGASVLECSNCGLKRKVSELECNTENLGAGIRPETDKYTAGLRFGVSINKAEYGIDGIYDYESAGVKFGALLVPEYVIANAGFDSVEEYYLNCETQSTVDVPAKKIYRQNDDVVQFTAVLVDIPESAYDTKICALPYVIIGGEMVFGTEMKTSYYEVALIARASDYSDEAIAAITDETKRAEAASVAEALDKIIAIVEKEDNSKDWPEGWEE